ncbi:3-phosphoshikimate 1-carboxyvinyltransferase [bacterium]|nr:3-phosphoshikimate 1-carboxyvinyltransferase [bacterium]
MRIGINPSTICGELSAPASKSIMQRAILVAALAHGKSVLVNPCYSADALAAIDIAVGLGAHLDCFEDRVEIVPTNKLYRQEFNCGESGLSLRLLTAIAGLFDQQIFITGSGSLRKRPIDLIEKPLTELGVKVKTNQGLLPVTITGPIVNNRVTVDCSVTSQFLSGLLTALPLAKVDSEIQVINLKSKPYVDITLELLRSFGAEIEANAACTHFKIKGNQRYQARTYTLEGDWSGAAFLLVAGAVAGEIKLKNLNLQSEQGDKIILEVLKMAKAGVKISETAIEVSSGDLSAFEFDATDCPDLFPPLVALALNCQGTSRIKGVHRLAHKESDRAQVLVQEFAKLGATLTIEHDYLCIPASRLSGAVVLAHADHRIAMALAVAGLKASGSVEIDQAESVAKSYPTFFDDLRSLMH